MSKIYSKVTIKKNWRSQDFDCQSLKNLFQGQFLERSNSRRYHWILKLVFVTQKSEVWEQNCVWLFNYFNFERSYDVLKSKSLCILLNKSINFSKNETESKMENRTHSFTETNLRKVKSQIKSETDELELTKEKRRHLLYRSFCL